MGVTAGGKKGLKGLPALGGHYPIVGYTKEGIFAKSSNNLRYQYDLCWLHGNVVDVRMTASTLDMVVNFVGSVGVTRDKTHRYNTR